jgi:hypothetical protein
MHGHRSMREPHQVVCYDYVSRSYREVRDALIADAVAIFRQATRAEAARGDARLRADVGPLELAADVVLEVDPLVEDATRLLEPKSRLTLRWRAARGAGWFPVMDATLFVYPLAGHETQLELRGTYAPPLGALGAIADSLSLHRVAEASVSRLMADLAQHLGGRAS